MKKLILLLVYLLPAVADARTHDLSNVYKALQEASKTAGVPYRLLAAICFKESHLKEHQKPVWDVGSYSYGMCQIKEDTARDMGFDGDVEDLSDVFTNAKYAGLYLSHQLDKYHGDWIRALAAYNAGSSHWHIGNQGYVTDVLQKAIEF